MKLKPNALGHPVIQAPQPSSTDIRSLNERVHEWYTKRNRMPQWVICSPETRDYPGKFVVRLWVTLPEARPTRRVMLHDSLEQLHTMLPMNLARIARSANDDPVIIECLV